MDDNSFKLKLIGGAFGALGVLCGLRTFNLNKQRMKTRELYTLADESKALPADKEAIRGYIVNLTN